MPDSDTAQQLKDMLRDVQMGSPIKGFPKNRRKPYVFQELQGEPDLRDMLDQEGLQLP